ncbi:MAG: hypothetical protein ACYDA3_12180 [Gaiellaceae bacterium]
MRRAGRVVFLLFLAWLAAILLGGFGLTPVPQLPFAHTLRPSPGPAPVKLPAPAPTPAADLVPALPAAAVPVTTTSGHSASAPGHTKTTTTHGRSTTAPGHTKTTTTHGRSTTAPGHTKTTTTTTSTTSTTTVHGKRKLKP